MNMVCTESLCSHWEMPVALPVTARTLRLLPKCAQPPHTTPCLCACVFSVSATVLLRDCATMYQCTSMPLHALISLCVPAPVVSVPAPLVLDHVTAGVRPHCAFLSCVLCVVTHWRQRLMTSTRRLHRGTGTTVPSPLPLQACEYDGNLLCLPHARRVVLAVLLVAARLMHRWFPSPHSGDGQPQRQRRRGALLN